MSMEAGRIDTFTASDGYVLRYRHYPAQGPPRGRVVCIPGIQSHGRWHTASGPDPAAPDNLFPIPLDDPELFTATPRWQSFVRDDPRSLRRATARLLVASVFLDIAARRSVGHVRVPVLLLLAGKDRIIDNARTRA